MDLCAKKKDYAIHYEKDSWNFIEFVSYPSVDFKDRIKSSIYNNTYESITKNFHPRYEKCWFFKRK